MTELNTPSNPDSSPTPEISPITNHNRNLINKNLLIIALIILILCSMGGFYLYQQNSLKKNNQMPLPTAATVTLAEPTNTPTLPPKQIISTRTPLPTENPTFAGWKIYQDSGINFKYPPTWTYGKLDIGGGYQNLHGLVKFSYVNGQINDGRLGPLFIEYWDNPENLSIEDFDKKINEGRMMERHIFTSDSIKKEIGNNIVYYLKRGDCSPFLCHKFILLAHGKVWDISSQYTTNPDEFMPTLEQIISTIKFE